MRRHGFRARVRRLWVSRVIHESMAEAILLRHRRSVRAARIERENPMTGLRVTSAAGLRTIFNAMQRYQYVERLVGDVADWHEEDPT